MRHQVKGFKLGRTTAHRKATLSAMAEALIQHKRIKTTHVKAKALRMYVEPLLTKAKEDTTANRRLVFAHLQNKESVKELFDVIAAKIASRPGGYTRIVKLGQRPGDGTEMAVIELVDYNVSDAPAGKKKTRRTRRSSATAKADSPKADKADAAPKAAKASKKVEDAPAPTTPEATAGGSADNSETAPGDVPAANQS